MIAQMPAWLGSLSSWAVVALGLLVAWRLSRGGAGSAVSELSEANRVLTARVHELGAEVRDLKIENGQLKARTDFAQALSPLLERLQEGADQAAERQNGIIETMTHHEERAQERFRQTTNVLGLIADRLGPNGEAS